MTLAVEQAYQDGYDAGHREARAEIARLTRERDEARAGLRALLSYTEQLALMVYLSEQNETVHPTVQAARAALEGRT
jgi:flagellar biosynthesis/type III secretory pathway protein FliH